MEATTSHAPGAGAPTAPVPSVTGQGTGEIHHGVIRLLDLACDVSVVVGTGTISVRDCLALGPGHVLPLAQVAGEDLQILASGVLVARGEVMIDEEITSVRVTDIAPTAAGSV